MKIGSADVMMNVHLFNWHEIASFHRFCIGIQQFSTTERNGMRMDKKKGSENRQNQKEKKNRTRNNNKRIRAKIVLMLDNRTDDLTKFYSILFILCKLSFGNHIDSFEPDSFWRRTIHVNWLLSIFLPL